jgi:DNA-directed RNA polymerase specialized sigma24 family protein
MSPGEPERATLPLPEVAAALRGLPEAGWHRLRKIARYYASTSPLEADDLLQTALTRALAGDRQCPAQVEVIRFLAEAMRSIASDGAKSARRQDEGQASHSGLRLVPPAGDEEADLWIESSPNPEDALAGEQEAAHIKDAILRLFDDDLIAQTIIEGDMEEMEAEDIRSLTGLTKVAYASKRRLIRRRIDQAFPQGWKS